MVKNHRALIRKRAGLTQVKLARLVDISQSRISSWENGDSELPLGDIGKIANAIRARMDLAPQFQSLNDLIRALAPPDGQQRFTR